MDPSIVFSSPFPVYLFTFVRYNCPFFVMKYLINLETLPLILWQANNVEKRKIFKTQNTIWLNKQWTTHRNTNKMLYTQQNQRRNEKTMLTYCMLFPKLNLLVVTIVISAYCLSWCNQRWKKYFFYLSKSSNTTV